MLVLGIYGSPRKGGNTDLMLDAFLEGATAASAEVERLYVRDMNISGCISCGHCDQTGVCIQEDDMVKAYPLFEEAQRIVVASPVYFYGVTGQLKLMVDRSQASYMKKELDAKKDPKTGDAERKGFLLSAGATRGKRLFECPILTIKYFFDALDVEYAGDLCFREVEEKGAVHRSPSFLKECRQAGMEFVSTGRKP
jgi:multimeric flavodoxin WrbA